MSVCGFHNRVKYSHFSKEERETQKQAAYYTTQHCSNANTNLRRMQILFSGKNVFEMSKGIYLSEQNCCDLTNNEIYPELLCAEKKKKRI